MNAIPRTPWKPGSEAAARSLGLAIMQGEFPEGSHLPLESDLASSLSISRNTLREAMRLLAAKSLVTIAPRRGTVVADRRDWNVFDPDVLDWMAAGSGGMSVCFMTEIIDLRRIVEPHAAACAAERGDGARIAAAVDAMEREARSGHTDAALEADIAFHVAVADAIDNRFVARIGRSMMHALRMNFAALGAVPGNFAQNLANHRAVSDAVAARDPEEARAAMLRLIDRAGEDTARFLAERGQ